MRECICGYSWERTGCPVMTGVEFPSKGMDIADDDAAGEGNNIGAFIFGDD